MRLTIFTPTYNRISQIPSLYNSIIVALSKIDEDDCVEWIIIDDGSTEDISAMVCGFKEYSQLSIIFHRKENGGKHTAFNLAIDMSVSSIFVCIDDDDRVTENALKDIFDLAKLFSGGGYGGFVGRVVDENGYLQGRTIFEDTLVSNTIDIRDKYHFWGEPEVFYTNVLKKYRFDVFPGERFLTEAYLFDEMSCNYPFVYTNIHMMVKKFLPGGLTDTQLRIRMQCPRGCEAYYYKRKKLCKGFKHKLKAAINRQRFARYAGSVPKRETDIYEVIAAPIAWAMSIKDRCDCPGIV